MKSRYEVRIDFTLFQKRNWQSRPEEWFTSDEQEMLKASGFFARKSLRVYEAHWLYEIANPSTT